MTAPTVRDVVIPAGRQSCHSVSFPVIDCDSGEQSALADQVVVFILRKVGETTAALVVRSDESEQSTIEVDSIGSATTDVECSLHLHEDQFTNDDVGQYEAEIALDDGSQLLSSRYRTPARIISSAVIA